MTDDHHTISETSRMLGPACSTYHHWIKKGILPQREDGQISLREAKKAAAKHRNGRPLAGSYGEYQSLIGKLAAPFLVDHGLRRRHAVLRYCAFQFGKRGKDEAFTEKMRDALGFVAQGKCCKGRPVIMRPETGKILELPNAKEAAREYHERREKNLDLTRARAEYEKIVSIARSKAKSKTEKPRKLFKNHE
jgi:hypothetical protein